MTPTYDGSAVPVRRNRATLAIRLRSGPPHPLLAGS